MIWLFKRFFNYIKWPNTFVNKALNVYNLGTLIICLIMQLALTIIAGIGALLFIISFLGYVVSGFRHHFVTGLIAALPVLNIVTLPSLWDRNSRKFFVGLIGLVLASVAWFMGGDKGVQSLLSQHTYTESVVLSTSPARSNNVAPSQTSPIDTTQLKSNTVIVDESEMISLPSKALYKMGFEPVPISQLNALQGRIVQIVKTDNIQIEGRVKSLAQGSVTIEGQYENELPIASIKQLRLMVKKANQ